MRSPHRKMQEQMRQQFNGLVMSGTLTQGEIAVSVGMQQPHISTWLRNKRDIRDIETLDMLWGLLQQYEEEVLL